MLKGEELISELLNDPQAFVNQAKPDLLLQEYFRGFPLDTLRPLIYSDDLYLKSAAAYILSELGAQGKELIADTVKLLNEESAVVRFSAIESIMTCATGELANYFVYVVQALEDEHLGIRVQVMKLVYNASTEQLLAAYNWYGGEDALIHKKGLDALLKVDSLSERDIYVLLDENNALGRKYGTIALKKINQKFPGLSDKVLTSDDVELKKFFR